MNDTYWMQQAYQWAVKARQDGDVPVGAVLVDAQQQLIGQGWNQVMTTHDPTAHAELVALRSAAQHLKTPRLMGSTLYVTLEPCCMCAGALVHARVQRVVFATRDLKAGAAGSVYNLMQGYPLNHAVLVDEGPLQSECALLLSSFFSSLRA